MPVSSAPFETILTPDPQLRRLLLWSAWLLPSVGLLLVLGLSADGCVRALLCLGCLGIGVRDYRGLKSGNRRIDRILLESLDNVERRAPDGRRDPLELLAGSAVFARIAFLRMRFPDGQVHVELLRPQNPPDRHWQRLLLIWRLRRRVFGEPGA